MIARRVWDQGAFLGMSVLQKQQMWQKELVQCCSLLLLLQPQQQPAHKEMFPSSQPLLGVRSSMLQDSRRLKEWALSSCPFSAEPVSAGVGVSSSQLCSLCTRLPLPSSLPPAGEIRREERCHWRPDCVINMQESMCGR